jgi:hypothetical protein
MLAALPICGRHAPPSREFEQLRILIMWNDTDTPLAYFISFRTYGTWLHGDERSSTDRFHNQYGSPFIPPNEKWQRSMNGN